MSTTPTGLVGILLASGGNFLLPIFLSTAQLAVSRQWPDSDIPQILEQVKITVNVVGTSTTSLVAALNHCRLSRITTTQEEAAMARQVTADATETTALLGGRIGIGSAEDQMQGFATLLPVSYPPRSFPDAGFCFSCVNVHDRIL